MSEVFLNVFNTATMAGWLVLAIILARFLLKKAPAWVKCALWAIVALRLVWPFEIESVLSLIPSAQTLPPSELYAYTPRVHTGIYAANSVINPVFSEVFASEPANSVNPLQVVIAVASVVWIMGVVTMAVYAVISFLRLRRQVRVCMPVGEGVYLCDHISSPFILGVFRPKIFLPSNLSEEKRESILAHERAHLARRDQLWKPLGFTLLTVFWFHPLLWLAYILLCRDVELACDAKVIESLNPEEKKTYSEVLLECSIPGKWITACPLAFGETGVKQRIKAILHYKQPALWIIIAALVVGSLLAVCFLTVPKAEAQATVVITEEDIVGKTFVYEHEGAGGHFTISFQPDGTASYYEGGFSSHLGMDLSWSLDGNLLCMKESRWTLSGDREFSYYFMAYPQMLVFRGDLSDGFIYVDVADGDRFYDQNRRPESSVITEEDIIANTYRYEGGEDGPFLTVRLYADGICSCFEFQTEGSIHDGVWTISDNILRIQCEDAAYFFRVTEDSLIYLKEKSSRFIHLDIPDGTEIPRSMDFF